jgi:hypothetical protein
MLLVLAGDVTRARWVGYPALCNARIEWPVARLLICNPLVGTVQVISQPLQSTDNRLACAQYAPDVWCLLGAVNTVPTTIVSNLAVTILCSFR